MRNGSIAVLFAVFTLASGSHAAFAQARFIDLHAGECRITFQIPAGTDTSTISLAILADVAGGKLRQLRENSTAITMEYRLLTPLRSHELVEIAYGASGTLKQLVGAPRMRDVSLDDCPIWDERDDFESLIYAGEIADAFAPNTAGNYKPGTSYDSKTRFIAGADVQYRFVGEPGDQWQFWVRGRTLHGVRSADVDCSGTPKPPVCGTPSPDSYTFTVTRASSLEAWVEPRVEFWTLNKDREVPGTLYVFERIGFIDLPDSPKVFESDGVGIGARVPKGAFRDSEVGAAWGRTLLFESAPKWNRFKINAVLVFNMLPSLGEQAKFWNGFGKTARGFVGISVDRNPGGPGPEAVQSYFGLAFDIRQLHF